MQYLIFILNSKAHNVLCIVNVKVRKFSRICITNSWNDAVTQVIKTNAKQVCIRNATEYFF